MTNLIYAAALAVVCGTLIARRVGIAFEYADMGEEGDEYDYTPQSDDTQQLTNYFQDFEISMNPSTYTPAAVPLDLAARNEAAFLDMLAYAEGVATGAAGYQTLFGGQLFDNGFVDHPRIAKQFTDRAGRRLWTSAAGRYQFMAVSPIPGGGSTRVNTWDTLQRRLGLPDFGPESQDRAALELVRERGALLDVQAGRLARAVAKCAPVWASLPGAGYAQQERKLTSLAAQFVAAGGTLEA